MCEYGKFKIIDRKKQKKVSKANHFCKRIDTAQYVYGVHVSSLIDVLEFELKYSKQQIANIANRVHHSRRDTHTHTNAQKSQTVNTLQTSVQFKIKKTYFEFDINQTITYIIYISRNKKKITKKYKYMCADMAQQTHFHLYKVFVTWILRRGRSQTTPYLRSTDKKNTPYCSTYIYIQDTYQLYGKYVISTTTRNDWRPGHSPGVGPTIFVLNILNETFFRSTKYIAYNTLFHLMAFVTKNQGTVKKFNDAGTGGGVYYTCIASVDDFLLRRVIKYY